MRANLVQVLILSLFSASLCFSQNDNASRSPRIIIKLPEKLAPEDVWIRYSLNRNGSRGERMHGQDGSRDYVIFGSPNIPSQHAQLVLYSPGCEFKAYEFDLHPGSDIEERFQCDPLPTKTLHGFIVPAEIPRAIYSAREKRIDIEGDYDGSWICEYFLRPLPRREMAAGSCLSSEVPLGNVGTLDPAEGGKFEITIPDFTRDPAFKFAQEWKTKFGDIMLVLRDKLIGQPLGLMRPKDFASDRPALHVQAEYSDPMIFTTRNDHRDSGQAK